MHPISRRAFLSAGLAAPAYLAHGAEKARVNVHQQLLDLASAQQRHRRARFAAVRSKDDLQALQKALRQSFLDLLDGFPVSAGAPPVRRMGRIRADGYDVEKLIFESYPGYFVSALLYTPRGKEAARPGILSPCGHSAVGKAADPYQILHVNLARRGHVVLTYDPVGQGERSQFWDADRGRSRFNLACGEHAVLGNPLYLLGTNLARYRIWDGMRGIDYLASLPQVDAKRIGCVGNSGGGALTAYIAALDPRVHAASICCYLTALPRRMSNRIEADPDADPEQDIFGFVRAGIDHAGLLALRVPRPTLVNSARDDFVPREGANESCAEARRLYELAESGAQFRHYTAPGKHGLSRPLRLATYRAFDDWFFADEKRPPADEIEVKPRPAKELLVGKRGQVRLDFHSRHLLPLALEEFRNKKKTRRVPLKDLLARDSEQADFEWTEIAAPKKAATLVLCVNGNEAPDWRQEKEFLRTLADQGMAVAVVDPRGVGRLRPRLEVKGHTYDDPLDGVEENIAYNAFLVGKSLVGMRVADVLAAVSQARSQKQSRRVVLCGRRDAALIACLAAAVEPAIDGVAVEEMPLRLVSLFEERGQAINAASILPGLLRDFGDIAEVLAALAPRPVLVSAPREADDRKWPAVRLTEKRFGSDPAVLLDWLRERR